VARSIDQVEFVLLAVQSPVDGDRPSLHGDAASPFDFQIIQNLFTEFALSDRAALQQQLISQRAFAMVNMSHNAEIADELRVHNTQDFTTELTGKS